jgi:predicted Zn finger-like uncharacterized protein
MTIDAPCPNCGTLYTVRRDLIGKRTKCTRCGTPFVIAEMAPAQAAPSSPPPPATPSPAPDQELFADIPIHQSYTSHAIPPAAEQAAPRRGAVREFIGFEQDMTRPRFPAMRIVARAYEIMAVIVLLIAACLFIVFLAAVIREPGAILVAMLSSGLLFAFAFATALMLLFAAQSIRLGLQIEQNTRETGDACRQLAEHLCGIHVDE